MQCVKCSAELPEGAVFCHMCGRRQQPEKRKALKRANGTGTVYKLQGRRRRPWVAAKSKVIIGYYPTKTEALDALARLTGRGLTERYNMTFAEVFEAWKAEHYPTLTKSGQTQYNISFKVFESLHKNTFRMLRTDDYQKVIDGFMERPRSTVSKYKQLVTQMSQWAMREELIQTNFASFVRLPEEKKKEKDVFTDQEIEKMRRDGSEAAWITLMMIYTGMRIGELFTLRVEDFHQAYCIGGEKTDAGRDRVIPIPEKVQPYFEYFRNRADGPLLVSGYSGQHVPANFRKRDYYPLLERLGIRPLNPHCCRHTFASLCVRAGMQPEVLQKIIGHAKYATTVEHYVHSDIEQLIAASKCL